MQLSHERPDYTWVLRGADGQRARVNERMLERSFALAPDRLVEDWDVLLPLVVVHLALVVALVAQP